MKFGIRTPSPRKRAAAYGRGRYTRSIKRKLIPGYGKKGMGFLKNPSKSVYNKIYRKTTISLIKQNHKKRNNTSAISKKKYSRIASNTKHISSSLAPKTYSAAPKLNIGAIIIFSVVLCTVIFVLSFAKIASNTSDENYNNESSYVGVGECSNQESISTNETNERNYKKDDYITEVIIKYNLIAEYPVPQEYYDYIIDEKKNSSSYPATFSYRDKENDIKVEFSIIGIAKKGGADKNLDILGTQNDYA